jgi:stage V sporulation protein AE
MILVFISGGIICCAVQLLIDLTKLTPARILVLLVTSGVLLYAVGVYEPLRDVFGAGVSVPLLGFGATIAKGVREAVDTEGIIGILTGGLSASSSGITAALIFGLLASLVFRPRPKRM